VDPYNFALREAADNLFKSLGTLDDLGPELADTVANIYYRYALAASTVSDLTLALGIRGDDLTEEIGVIMAQQEYVDYMIQAVRRAGRDPALRERMKLLTLDTLKYRLVNPTKKSAVRRAVERRFAKVREITGLYQRMRGLLDDT
jgi:hypothetical protein